MIRFKNIIKEQSFNIYQAMVRVTHSEENTVQDIGEMLRGIPGVLTVVQVEHNSDNNTAIMKVKIITTKTAVEGFRAFVQNSTKRLPQVRKIEVAEKTIEKKK